ACSDRRPARSTDRVSDVPIGAPYPPHPSVRERAASSQTVVSALRRRSSTWAIVAESAAAVEGGAAAPDARPAAQETRARARTATAAPAGRRRFAIGIRTSGGMKKPGTVEGPGLWMPGLIPKVAAYRRLILPSSLRISR